MVFALRYYNLKILIDILTILIYNLLEIQKGKRKIMKFNKILAIILFAALLVALPAQTQTVTRGETTAEEDYLSNFEDIIIAELTASDEYDNKLLALQYIEDALTNAGSSRDMTQIQIALDSLAGEGVTTESRTAGRLINNFPDVRAKACDLLAQLPTVETKVTLTKIALADNEPMVATAAIRSLGQIGIDPDDAVATIAWVQKKYAVLNPTSSLAFEILNAFELLGSQVQDKSEMIQCISAIAVNYQYVTPVRDKAKALLKQYTGR